MIVGDPTTFAVESEINEAVPSVSQRGLGFFVIHVGGRAFGVREPDASMLGCSFEAVNDRLRRKGTHCIPVLDRIDARLVVEAYLDAMYRASSRADYFGLTQEKFADCLHASAVIWAPDGDAAFDDGGHVLQFDVGSRVRLIAFANEAVQGGAVDAVVEEWLDADLFYDTMARWSEGFALEWTRKLAQGRTGSALKT